MSSPAPNRASRIMEWTKIRDRIHAYKVIFTVLFVFIIISHFISIAWCIYFSFFVVQGEGRIIFFAFALAIIIPSILIHIACMIGFRRESLCMIGCFAGFHLTVLIFVFILTIGIVIAFPNVDMHRFKEGIGSMIITLILGLLACHMFFLVRRQRALERSSNYGYRLNTIA